MVSVGSISSTLPQHGDIEGEDGITSSTLQYTGRQNLAATDGGDQLGSVEILDGLGRPVNDDVSPVTLQHVSIPRLQPDVDVPEVDLVVRVDCRVVEVRALVPVNCAEETPSKPSVGVLLAGSWRPVEARVVILKDSF